MVQVAQPGAVPGQSTGGPTLPGPSAQSLPPLLDLPEPEKLPTGDDVVDLPEEVLFDSAQVMRKRAGWKIWVWMAAAGAVSWGILGAVFLGSISPLVMFLPLFALAEPGFISSFLGGLGVSLWEVLLLACGAAPFGALVGLGAAALGLRSVARLRPREYLTEKLFRQAIGWSFAKWLMWPQLAVIAMSMLLTALPGNSFMLADFSYIAVAGYLSMIAVVIVSVPFTAGCARSANPLGLPGHSELEMKRQAAMGTPKFAEYTRVMFAQDRRHLPRNTLVVSARMFLASFCTLLRYRAWQIVLFAALLAPFYFLADLVQLFSNIEDLKQVNNATDFSLMTRLAFVLLVIAWASALAWLPPLVLSLFHLIPPSKRGVRDQRTYPTISERLSVNRWERGVVWATTLSLAAIEAVCLVAFIVVQVASNDAGEASSVHTGALAFAGFVACALGMISTYRAIAIDLRTIVYGPAGWYMRREVPFAAIAPKRGTRAEMADDPRVRVAVRERQAMALGLPKNASLEQIAKFASRTGVLPDFGLGDEQAAPAIIDPPAVKGEHDIPEDLEELHAGRLTL